MLIVSFPWRQRILESFPKRNRHYSILHMGGAWPPELVYCEVSTLFRFRLKAKAKMMSKRNAQRKHVMRHNL